MATVSTEHIEGLSASEACSGRSRRRIAWNAFVLLLSINCGGGAVEHFQRGHHAWGYSNGFLAILLGVGSLVSLITGRSTEKDFGNWLGRHPRFALVFFIVLNLGLFAWIAYFKYENDRLHDFR